MLLVFLVEHILVNYFLLKLCGNNFVCNLLYFLSFFQILFQIRWAINEIVYVYIYIQLKENEIQSYTILNKCIKIKITSTQNVQT